MCYSGGKDSTYTLTVLRETYELNVLAVSLDNGFVAEQTLLNIRRVVENLGVDYITIKPRFDILARIFRYCANNYCLPRESFGEVQCYLHFMHGHHQVFCFASGH